MIREKLAAKHPNDIAETIAALAPEEQPVAFLLLPGHFFGALRGHFGGRYRIDHLFFHCFHLPER